MSSLEIGRSAPLTTRSAEWLRLARLAKLLAWISLAWLCIEGSVAVAAGLIAGSIATPKDHGSALAILRKARTARLTLGAAVSLEEPLRPIR
jgi:hypothetical protein